MAGKDYYATLGVDKNASEDDIKSAYRKMAKQYHPDLHPNDEKAANKFKEINEAYEVLGDSKKRQNYDQFGSADGANFSDFFRGGQSGGFSSFGGGGFGDIFSDLFSAFGGGQGAGGRVAEQGEDIDVSIDLSFEDACFGAKKEFIIPRYEKCPDCGGTGAKNGRDYSTCSECNGTGRVTYSQRNGLFGTSIMQGVCKNCNGTGKIIKDKCTSCSGKGYKKVQRTVSVSIPAGIDNGQVITMRGEGNAPIREGINGDLHIGVNVRPHKYFVRKGYDLYLELYLPFTMLLLGGKVKIPLLEKEMEIELKECTQSGTIVRIKGKGVKILKQSGYGDLIVTIKSEAPKTLDKKTKEQLEQMQGNFSQNAFPKYENFKNQQKK